MVGGYYNKYIEMVAIIVCHFSTSANRIMPIGAKTTIGELFKTYSHLFRSFCANLPGKGMNPTPSSYELNNKADWVLLSQMTNSEGDGQNFEFKTT